MRALITGGGGFVGRKLAAALRSRGDTVVGADRQAAIDPLLTDRAPFDSLIALDVCDQASVANAVAVSRPEIVFHLAGITYVPEAGNNPVATFEVNSLGVVRLLDALLGFRDASGIDPFVLVVGSAEQYGRHPIDDLPLSESAQQRPATIYAASKAAQEIVALQRVRANKMRVVATRSFNHSGAGQTPAFLLPGLVKRAMAAKHAASPALRMGNGTPIRDFLHVEDVVAAYLALAEHGDPGEVYNVCSGSGVSANQLAERVLDRIGLDAPIQVDPALVRPVDVEFLVGCPDKLIAATRWQARFTIDDIIDDLIHAATV